MPSWWGKCSSKDEKRKTRSFIDAIHWKLPKNSGKCGGPGRYLNDDALSEKGSVLSGPESPSLPSSRCQSFKEQPHPLPLPLPQQLSSSPPDDVSEVTTSRSLATSSVSINISMDNDDLPESQLASPQEPEYDSGNVTAINSPSGTSPGDGSPIFAPEQIFKDPSNPVYLPSKRCGPLRTHVTKLQIPPHPGFFSAPDSFVSSPSHSPDTGQNSEDVISLSSTISNCSSECSPIQSPRRTSTSSERKVQCHRLPLPPMRNQAESLASSISCWKKGQLIGSGTYGRVYLGFNSESGEMCAMKEVALFFDDALSRDSVQQLVQEINLLSGLRHPNIVRYFGSEMVDDKLYIHLEYVSGGSIHKVLREYGRLGESAIRSYTKQILSGLAYLHAKNTVHRDIKGANILVDPTGRVKLADFGMAKHITGQPCPLSFKGSPYWMAPEVIRNSSGGSNLAVDIWSLGCTVIEMATGKPPWSQYEGVAALFKIVNSRELPAIPDHLSEEGKDFVRQCLQRNPLDRPTAVQLLQHPFIRNAGPLKRPLRSSKSPEVLQTPVSNSTSHMGTRYKKKFSALETERAALQLSRGFKISDPWIPKHLSCPVSPVGSPLLHPKLSSQRTLGRMRSPSITTLRPHTTSSTSSTPYYLASCSYGPSRVQRPKNMSANHSPLSCKLKLESSIPGISHISRRKAICSRCSFSTKPVYAPAYSGGLQREL